jgi:hypothetical protein
MRGSTYILEGQASELSQHNGHEVEVTGTLASAASSTGSTGSSTGAASSSPGAAGTTPGSSASTAAGGSTASAGQRLNVTSVRMIASTCSEK